MKRIYVQPSTEVFVLTSSKIICTSVVAGIEDTGDFWTDLYDDETTDYLSRESDWGEEDF